MKRTKIPVALGANVPDKFIACSPSLKSRKHDGTRGLPESEIKSIEHRKTLDNAHNNDESNNLLLSSNACTLQLPNSTQKTLQSHVGFGPTHVRPLDQDSEFMERRQRKRQPIPAKDIPKPILKQQLHHKNSSLIHVSNVKVAYCPINCLEEKFVNRILSYVNHSDLVQCRAVQKRWNALITTKAFINKTVYVVNIQKTYNVATDTLKYDDLTKNAELSFLHGRFQYLDYTFISNPQRFVMRNSDNQKYFPSENFLENLKTLEFRSCFLQWQTVKRFLVKAVNVESLTIFNCYISPTDDATPSSVTQQPNEFEEYKAGIAIFALKKLEIYESNCLSNITSILQRLNGYSNDGLTSLKIKYYPSKFRMPEHDDPNTDSVSFCRELIALITGCANSLQVLRLNIYHEATLNLMGSNVCNDLQVLGGKMNLIEFELSPSLSCWMYNPELMPKTNMAISSNRNASKYQRDTKAAACSLARFLESQQHLEVLGIPCLEDPDEYGKCFQRVLENFPAASNIKCLAVPSPVFLPVNFMDCFPNLIGLKVGGSCCQDESSGWEIFEYYTKNQVEDDASEFLDQNPQIMDGPKSITFHPNHAAQVNISSENLIVLKRMRKLAITTNLIPNNFKAVVQSLCHLTKLDISSNEPVIQDDDLQACIKYLHTTLLQLYIGCCEKITDYGITGIPEKYCKLMFRNQKYIYEDIDTKIWSSVLVTGRPLSDLKGLKKLALIGLSKFTDIGVAYGLRFQELNYANLPYSDAITSWGIERFASTNPSLETFTMSGVNQLNKDAFKKIREHHKRIKLGDPFRSGYFMERTSPLSDDFSMVLPSFIAVRDLFAFIINKIQALLAIFAAPLARDSTC